MQQTASCTGKAASAQVKAIWADGSQASAEAVFYRTCKSQDGCREKSVASVPLEEKVVGE
ncbi:MAG TPA: hypothetical protein VFQ36_04770 [Ktedonobacteraceae bacterium]|nr:hypothetical protein [Ktedonobacteraceae bacterium]